MGDEKTESAGNTPPPHPSSSAPAGESDAYPGPSQVYPEPGQASQSYPEPSQDWIQLDGKRPDDIPRSWVP